MRLAIVSDIHANLEALCATLHRIANDRIDRIFCLGDIVGYNSDPAECLALLRGFQPLCVAGNHDRAVSGVISTQGFSRTAARAVRWTRRRLDDDALAFLAALPLTCCLGGFLIGVHGALHPPTGKEMVRLDSDEARRLTFDALRTHPSGARICAFGHTHQPGIYEYRGDELWVSDVDEVPLRDDAYYLVNPGSVGQSRTGDERATYLVLDTVRHTICIRRVDYDCATALARTRMQGLVPRSVPLLAALRSRLKQGARVLGLYGPSKRDD